MFDAINTNSQNPIVFIDSAIADYEKLAAGVEPRTEVIILDSTKNGIAQITDKLASRRNLSALHIVSHGSAGSLQLGNDFLTLENINNYAAQLKQWQKALSENADILIYGCNVASEGKSFLQRFAELTGADIAASDNLTGNAELGGDWDLKVQIGEITSPLVFSPATMAEYQGVLNSIVSISPITINKIEEGASGVYRVGRTDNNGELTVNIAIDNSSLATADDYTLAVANSGEIIKGNTFSVTIPNGVGFVDLNLNAIAEVVSFAEGNESLKLNLAAGTGYQIDNIKKTATITINANGFLVTNTEDSINPANYKQGSLRQAILNANQIAGKNTIAFDTNGVFATAQTITLSGEELSISDHLSLQGTGANNLTISGNNASRIFSLIGKGVTIDLDGLTITKARGVPDLGGGIFIGEGSTLNLTNSNISHNEASIGGGIGNSGILNLTNSTVSGNLASWGGGIYNTGIINLINSTISGNTALADGGGINNDFIGNNNVGTANLINVTVANNSANNSGAGLFNAANANFNLANTIIANNNNTDLQGGFIDKGNNLIGKSNGTNGLTNGVNGSIVGTVEAPIDPKLAPLANNGGTTLTHALLTDSPAINQGNNALIPANINTDQRNLQRIIDNKIDIGAIEFLGNTISKASVSFSQANYQVNENGQVIGAAVRIDRTGSTNSEASIQVQFSNGSATGGQDFNNTTQTITFASGETNKIVNLSIIDDNLIENIEDFNLTLVNPIGNIIIGNQSTAKIQINDNDFVSSNPTPVNPPPQLLEVDCFCDEIIHPDVNNLPGVSVELNSDDRTQWGNDEDNFLISTNSNNSIFAFGGHDLLWGGIGNDNLLGGTENDVIFGNEGRDWIGGNEGEDIINCSQGDDLANGNQGNDSVYGGQGNDFVRGGQNNDFLLGDVGNDTLAGDKGNDTVFGGGSDAFGNSDSDLIFGGSGDDLLHGNTSNDSLFGEEGNDTIHAGKDDDIVSGGVGDDILCGDFGNDSLCGEDGNDTIFGGNGDSSSAKDDDKICGGIGNDLLFGNQGADWIHGDIGNDTLYGGKGNDTLYGGDDNDWLSGDLGNDTLTGGNGSDTFVLAIGKGSDVITDFQDGIDSFELSDNLTFQQLSIVQSGNNTLISLTSNNELLATLNGISVNLITQQDFVLLA
ncbi:DUF4347 domain-containing protein [Aerosakkonemataceae cyanobacterium BLCC-F154]|uniref:DUF4347 domain-containing protein n=1 Tax=Floridaenema fluviatile BLCC-F154 TaxID=3153640 RepID=A0ABV4YBL9_9CYAN